MVHPAIGRIVRLYPTDWDAKFQLALAKGEVEGPGPDGYYQGTIAKVDARGRKPVTVELRDLQQLETYRYELDFARERLVLTAGEDPWVLLPGKAGVPKPARPKASKKRRMMLPEEHNIA